MEEAETFVESCAIADREDGATGDMSSLLEEYSIIPISY